MSKLKLSNPSGSDVRGNLALGTESVEDQIAHSKQLAEYEKRIKQLEQNIAKLKKHLEQGEKLKPQAKSVSQGKARHIAHAEGWQAVCTAPDFCKIGKDVVAFNSFATLDQKRTASPNVKARGTAIYRQGDVLQNVQADAGKHVVSGTSLGSGHVKILDGHANVKVNGVPVARHDSRCLINCDASGVGGAQGKLVTEQKAAGAPRQQVESAVPPGQRTSPKLEALKKAREAVAAGMLNFDALDEYVNFAQSNDVLDELIKKISAEPGTGADYAAQFARGLLGFTKDAVLSAGELAYEGIKGVPKLARLGQTESGKLHAQLDAQILAENIRLDNITASSVGQSALNIGKAIVAPVVEPWKKGQHLEAVTRGAAEVLSLGLGWLKGSRAVRAPKSPGPALRAAPSKTVGSAMPAVIHPAGAYSTHSKVSVGIHVAAPKKPKFSGNWDNYHTHGLRVDPMKSIEGRKMVAEFEKKGLDRGDAVAEAKVLMKTGSSMPIANPVEVGDRFYKVVPADATVGPNSAFWATENDLAGLKGLSYDQIADRLAIPLVSQQGVKFEVVEIRALRPGMTFTSIIAPSTEIGANGTVWSQSGNGIQTLLTDRSIFTSPKLTTMTFP